MKSLRIEEGFKAALRKVSLVLVLSPKASGSKKRRKARKEVSIC